MATDLMDFVGHLGGGAPESVTDPGERFAEAMGRNGPDGAWAPTELGETLAWSLMTLICRTAPAGVGVKAWIACEEDGALDRIMADVQASVLREIDKAGAA